MSQKREPNAGDEGIVGNDHPAVVQVDHVSKRYCRNLRRSLWYGVQDICREMTLRNAYSGELRVDEFEAVKDASFQVGPGECVALLGPNGAGKSTMLKMINGILRPNEGSIRIHGRISALIELGTGFNPILSGRENVFINASVLGFSKEETEERFEEILKFSEIGEFIDTPVCNYSSGMRVRLGFAVASHLAPDLMLIDEVLAVGDQAFRLKCYEHLQQRVASGVSVILVSHIVAMMPRFCTRAIVFDKGSIVFDGGIMEGIAEYQKILGIEKAKLKALNEDDSATVGGIDEDSGLEKAADAVPDAEISSVRLLNGQLEACDTFETNEPLVAEVVISTSQSFNNCKLVLNLDSASFGLVASMASQRQQFTFDLIQGKEKKIYVRLNKLPVIDGGYSFNVALYGENKSQLLDQKNALAPFRVLNEKGNRRALKGVLVLDHEWSESKEAADG